MAKPVKRKCPQCGEVKEFRADQKTCGCPKPPKKVAVVPKPVKPPKPVEVESDERNGDERTLKIVVSKHIHTLEELAEECQIDTSIWEIYKWRCGAWQTGMKTPTIRTDITDGKWYRKTEQPIYSQQFVVMAWMRLKHNVIRANNEIDELRKKAADLKPAFPNIKIIKSPSTKIIDEYSIFDQHFGSLAWGKETGWADYDSKIAKECYEQAVGSLISRTSSFGAHKAVLVLGNDQQNFDNSFGTTTKGTRQDTDSRYQKVFGISRDCSIWAVESLLSVHDYVDVIVVPGNHDTLSAWHLGDSLASWFRSCDRVKVDNEPNGRKYYQWGTNMLLFTHGCFGKLENYGRTMASERPEMWGATKWREAHTGDKHHRELLEVGGATVRILPSLRPPDAWTSENHFVGSVRAAEAYVWHADDGLIGTAVYSVLK